MGRLASAIAKNGGLQQPVQVIGRRRAPVKAWWPNGKTAC